MNKRIAVLVSGGLDSCALLAEMASSYKRVWPLYVRQGLVWERAELHALKAYLRQIALPAVQPLQILDLSMSDVYGVHWSTGHGAVPGARTSDKAVYLPGRNLILTVKAAVFAAMHQIPTLALGSLGHNPFPDATPRFFRQWSQALGKGLGRPLSIVAPYRQCSKAEVIRRGIGWPLHLSLSCISPKGFGHCGRCNKCAERRRAFREAHVEDQTIYET